MNSPASGWASALRVQIMTAESRVGEPVAANEQLRLNTCDFPNTEHVKPKASGEAETEPIGTTSNHPFWSVDRQEFVQAGSLEIAERLQTLSGDVKVVQQNSPGPQPVFYLEVHNEHVYVVGHDGVLVHNDCLETQKRLAVLTSNLRDELVKDVDLLSSYLTKRQLKAIKKDGWQIQLYFGHAVEKRVAELAKKDGLLKDLTWTGVSNKPYDFIGTAGTRYDITGGSRTAIMKHSARNGVDVVVSYNSITSKLGYKIRDILK